MIHRSRLIFLGATFALLCPLSGVRAQEASSKSPHPRPVLIELFTSEGCSSCPPADALLREMNGSRTASGQLIIGISEHVTYWNNLGWKDPFSSPLYTERQGAYTRSLGLDSDYTPQMVVNGRLQFVGSDRAKLQYALSEEAHAKALDLHILSASVTGTSLKVAYTITEPPQSPHPEIVAVITDDIDRSEVKRGENSGRTLTHVAVARVFIRVPGPRPLADQALGQTLEIPLPPGFDVPAGHHVIVFAQQGIAGPVLGSATLPL